EKLPVQRLKPLTEEEPDAGLRESYRKLLIATSAEVFETGDFALIDTGVYGVVAFIRQDRDRTVVYIGQISDAWHTFAEAELNITAIAERLGRPAELRLTNLLNTRTTSVGMESGAFRVRLAALGLSRDDRFCLLVAQSGLS